MSDIAIRVEGLSKRYKIRTGKQQHYDTLRDHLAGAWQGFLRHNGRQHAKFDTFYALKDVSFEVKQGEIIGIIGRNGAGKSTLLKILSRITEPTSGMAEIYGRLSSLLEVGTGFHGELSGRENIYLNAAILGMRKADINRKFDAIVDFAGVEQFLNTPVKHYSSGMYVRLAFAVAAHLDPDILVIDEVLAVGDAAFQEKCLGRMGEVAREGRTVIFVSHNMGAVANLCTTGMLLDSGQVVMRSDVQAAINAYLKSTMPADQPDPKNWKHVGTGEVRITAARLLDYKGTPCTTFSMGEALIVEFDAEFHRDVASVSFWLEFVRTDMGLHIVHLVNEDCGLFISQVPEGKRSFRVVIPNCLIYPASYQISLCAFAQGVTFDYVGGILNFSMAQSAVSKRTTRLSMHTQAIVYIPSEWQELS